MSDPVPEYIAAHVASCKALSDEMSARDAEYRKQQDSIHPHLRDCSDPSVNVAVGVVGYAWMAARGD